MWGRNGKGAKRQGDEMTWDKTARGQNDHKTLNGSYKHIILIGSTNF